MVNVTFKFSAKTFNLDVDVSGTVGTLKTQIESSSEIDLPASGKILKDDDASLESTGISADATVHIVRSGPAATTSATPAAPAVPAAPAASAAPVAPANPFAAMGLGGAAGAGGMPDLSALFGGAGGAGGMPDLSALMGGMPAGGAMDALGGMNPAQLQEMLNNPMMQQMMQSITQSPGFGAMMAQRMQQDPMMQQMMQGNPMMQQMMSDPQLMQQMFQPDSLNRMMEATRSMFGGAGGAGGAGGMPDLAALMGGMGAPGAAGAGGMPDLSALFGGAGGAGGMPDLAALLGGMGGGAPEDTSLPPAERYANQLSQLEGMGFIDRDANIQALTEARGDVNMAISRLLERGLGN